MKHITRMNYEQAKGWWVRLQRNKKVYQKHFPDEKYQSSDWAFINAVSYLCKVYEKLPEPKPKKKNPFKITKTKITQKKYGKTFSWHVYMVRYKKKDGIWTLRSWSEKKYGEHEAFKQAKQFSNKINNRGKYEINN